MRYGEGKRLRHIHGERYMWHAIVRIFLFDVGSLVFAADFRYAKDFEWRMCYKNLNNWRRTLLTAKLKVLIMPFVELKAAFEY